MLVNVHHFQVRAKKNEKAYDEFHAQKLTLTKTVFITIFN
jgi:hypothetical protein